MKKIAFSLIGIMSICCAIGAEPALPDYKVLYEVMAKDVTAYLGKDMVDVYKVAGDSTLKYLESKNNGLLIVVELDYKDPVNSSINGATGNGSFYIFSIVNQRWSLVARIDGKMYDWIDENDGTTFTTIWGNGGGSYTETDYIIIGSILKSKNSKTVTLQEGK